MNIEASNLTHAEYYRLNGTMSGERIEALLDAVEVTERTEFVVDTLHDANARLKALCETMRGSRKMEMQCVIASLETIPA